MFMMCELSDSVYVLSGSYSEGCPLPPYFVESKGAYVVELSDIDMMMREAYGPSVYLVGFHRGDGSDIKAVIETTQTHPGYLRLRGMDGEYIQNSGCSVGILILETLITQCVTFSRHGPSVETNLNDSQCNSKSDFVRHYPCASWPPEAEPWIDRYRPSNWPTRDTIREDCIDGMFSGTETSSTQPSF